MALKTAKKIADDIFSLVSKSLLLHFPAHLFDYNRFPTVLDISSLFFSHFDGNFLFLVFFQNVSG